MPAEPVDYRFLIRDPQRIVPTGRPRGRVQGRASTGRILSPFEQLERDEARDAGTARGCGRGRARARGRRGVQRG
jgi:hypothetical protein